MKNKKILSIIIFFVLFSKGFSQTIITGTVYSNNNDTIKFFDVIILSPEDSTILTSNSFLKEHFIVKVNKKDSCLLKILSFGYEDKYIKINTAGKDRIKLGKILLTSINQLDEVIIKTKKPVIKRQNGNLIVDIKNSSIKNSVNMQEVFRKTPGIVIDKTKNIIVPGKGTPIIYINDKKVFSKTELDALRPGDINYIEIIRNPGAEFDASASAVIKIITKKITTDRLNASVGNSSYYGERFSNITEIKIQSKYHKITNSLSLTQQFWNYTDFEKYEEYIFQNSGSVFENKGKTFSDKSADASKLFFNTEYKPNAKHKFAAQIFLSNYIGKDSVKTNQIINNDIKSDYPRNINKYKETKRNSIGSGISWYFTPDTLKTFSLIVDYTTFDYDFNSFINENIPVFEKDAFIKLNNRSNYTVYSGKADYRFKSNNFGYTYGINFSSVDNNGKTNYFSNNLLYDKVSVYINDKIYGSYMQLNKTTDKLYIRGGLRFEYSKSKNKVIENNETLSDTTYFNFFPNLILNYDFNKNFVTTISYSKKISRPAFKEINPKKEYYDSLSYFVGNPHLKPSYRNNFELSVNLFEMLDLSFNYSLIKDKRFIVALDDNNIMKYTYINLDTYKELGINLDFAYDGNWYSNYASINFTKPFANLPYLQTDIDINKPMALVYISNEFLIGETTFYIDISYDSPGNYGISYYKDSYYVSTGIYRNFLKDKLFVSVSLSDIFKTDNTAMTDKYSNIYVYAFGYEDSRRIELSLTYNFNNFKKLHKYKKSNNEILNRLP